MTRSYRKLIIPIAIIFLPFMLIARALGTTQPPNPALRGFVEGCEDKPQPCWYGIVPGVTTLEEALNVMEKMGYPIDVAEQWETDLIFRGIVKQNMTVGFNHIYFPTHETEIVTYIYLRDLGDLRLSDVLAFFGAPTEIVLTAYPNDLIYFPPHISTTLDGHYSLRLSQNLSEIELTYYYPLEGRVKWKGRLRRDVYCEMQMEKIGIACK